jgi:hypothetical protein
MDHAFAEALGARVGDPRPAGPAHKRYFDAAMLDYTQQKTGNDPETRLAIVDY